MSHTYAAKVLADSIANGVRLTTFEVTFPRFILAEFNTHRVFSRNSASSRAIPPEKNIENVRHSPFIPETLGSRVKGMGYGTDLTEDELELGWRIWREAQIEAVDCATRLNAAGVDKSRVNRLLEREHK